jgi:hypothetical protein
MQKEKTLDDCIKESGPTNSKSAMSDKGPQIYYAELFVLEDGMENPAK